MSTNKVRYPGRGCLVEFMQGNSPMQAVVLEEQGGRLRLYGINRRESSLQSNRLLPWSGPNLAGSDAALSRQRMDEAMEEHRALRASIAESVNPLDVWELTQGEVGKTSAEWLAGLIWEQPGIDHEAALGHVLLNAKTHFRFSPPDFEIFTAEVVEARLAEAEATRIRENFAVTGAQFFQKLWDFHCRRRAPVTAQDEPDEALSARLKSLLMARIADPEGSLLPAGDDGDPKADAAVWKLLTKGLPEEPYLELHLAVAWGLVPEHYNFWLDRADFERGDAWAEEFAGDCAQVRRGVEQCLGELAPDATPYVSADPDGTLDRDDAFFVEALADGGFTARITLACPAAVWPFGSGLDKAALRRGTSLYLPEGDEHMLPASVGRALFSLDAGQPRPALRFEVDMAADGSVVRSEPALCVVQTAANLTLEECEALLGPPESRPAGGEERAEMLAAALALARLCRDTRIAAGAVVTERPDPEVTVKTVKGETRVDIDAGPDVPLTHLVVSELMILCNSALTAWCMERGVPLLYRTQDVALPREFAGIWSTPQDISRVVRALPPAALEAQPRRHAGLGLSAYAPLSSPIRRYVDLLNQSQVLSFLQSGAPRLDAPTLAGMLVGISACGDAVAQVQRMRPRYWKLLYFRLHGDKQWWDAVVTDENDAFVTVSLPWAQLIVRGKRRLFDDKLYPGMPVQVRLGKVAPLLGDIRILEAREA